MQAGTQADEVSPRHIIARAKAVINEEQHMFKEDDPVLMQISEVGPNRYEVHVAAFMVSNFGFVPIDS